MTKIGVTLSVGGLCQSWHYGSFYVTSTVAAHGQAN